MKNVQIYNVVVIIVLSAGLGFAAVVFPPYMMPGRIQMLFYAPLFPIIRTALEKIAFLPTVIALFMTGCVLGFCESKFWWLIAPSALSPFPVVAILEIIVDPSSHNLWPFEFFLYGILSIPAFIGALIGSFIRKMVCGRNRKGGRSTSGGNEANNGGERENT